MNDDLQEKRMAGDYEVIRALYIGDREIVLGENVQDDTGMRYMCAFCRQNALFAEYSEVMASDDFPEIVELFGQRIAEQAQKTRIELSKPRIQGIDAAVINIHTIKPIDAACVTEWAEKCGKVITVEEHSVIGGLGDAVADVLMGKVNCKFHKIGVNDRFGQSGKAADVLREYGLTADQIAETVKANI